MKVCILLTAVISAVVGLTNFGEDCNQATGPNMCVNTLQCYAVSTSSSKCGCDERVKVKISPTSCGDCATDIDCGTNDVKCISGNCICTAGYVGDGSRVATDKGVYCIKPLSAANCGDVEADFKPIDADQPVCECKDSAKQLVFDDMDYECHSNGPSLLYATAMIQFVAAIIAIRAL